jgi:cytoskeletal protein RodZ
MSTIGETLRTQRENQGRQVTEIAEELCITTTYVRAIEHDDLKRLPGLFFYKNFVRQYAAILGVDQAQLKLYFATLTACEQAPAMRDHCTWWNKAIQTVASKIPRRANSAVAARAANP